MQGKPEMLTLEVFSFPCCTCADRHWTLSNFSTRLSLALQIPALLRIAPCRHDASPCSLHVPLCGNISAPCIRAVPRWINGKCSTYKHSTIQLRCHESKRRWILQLCMRVSLQHHDECNDKCAHATRSARMHMSHRLCFIREWDGHLCWRCYHFYGHNHKQLQLHGRDHSERHYMHLHIFAEPMLEQLPSGWVYKRDHMSSWSHCSFAASISTVERVLLLGLQQW